MDDDRSEDPGPPAEALLIRRHRMAVGWSVAEAAAKTDGRVSHRRWGQIEAGFLVKEGRKVPTRASEQTLAHMAAAVRVTPEQLVEVGQREAAEVLAVIVADREVGGRQGEQRDRQIAAQMADYFADDSIPIDERRAAAERFFRALPYLAVGERPPRELFEGDDPTADDGPRRRPA